ncbi:MAG: PASTA domain-containing protein, partial [Clostridium sp.]
VSYYKYKEPEIEKVSVPDFVGKTLGEAKSLANSKGLNISVVGEDKDIVEWQSISPSNEVEKGTTIELKVKKEEIVEPEKPEEGQNQQ